LSADEPATLSSYGHRDEFSEGIASMLRARRAVSPASAEFVAAFLVALGYQLRIGIRAVSDLLERRFAEFAGVPYRSPASRQQWEELWETEAETSQRRIAIRRLVIARANPKQPRS
jgi:hypothetical protein